MPSRTESSGGSGARRFDPRLRCLTRPARPGAPAARRQEACSGLAGGSGVGGAGGRTNWTRIEDFTRRIAGPCGSEVLDCFALGDFLDRHRDDAALLDRRFRPADGVRIRREHAVRPEGWLRVETSLRATGGAEHSVRVDPAVDALMIECDGRAPLRQAIGRFAEPMRLSPDAATPAALRTVRALLDRGLLRPVDE